MINFFRNIRKKLVVEKPSANRTASYLKYAIGEIALVVIGILVALSINNWNENRQQLQDEKYILKQFLVDLNNDVNQLKSIILSTERRRGKVDSIAAILENPSKYQLIQFLQLQSALTNDDYFKAAQGTFKEGISSGRLKYIRNNNLRKQIYNYYESISDDRNNDYSTYKITNEHIMPIIIQEIGSTNEVANMYLGINNKLPKLDLKAVAQNKRYFQAIIYAKEDIFQLGDWKHYKLLVLDLLQKIEEELKLFDN